jgi:hypothetical protein
MRKSLGRNRSADPCSSSKTCQVTELAPKYKTCQTAKHPKKKPGVGERLSVRIVVSFSASRWTMMDSARFAPPAAGSCVSLKKAMPSHL